MEQLATQILSTQYGIGFFFKSEKYNAKLAIYQLTVLLLLVTYLTTKLS